MKKLVVLLFVAMMAIPALVAQGAGSTPVPTCLTVTGTAAATPTTVDVDEPIALTYTLTPGGSYTQVVTRSAVNLVMVLDESGSMSVKDDGYTSRMNVLKASAKSLIDQLKTVNLHDKVGLVKFDTTASKLQDLIDATTTSGASTLKTKIDSLNPDGGTNIEHGLRLANTMLSGLSNPYVILVTDGYATHYTNSDGRGTESLSKAKSLALTAADQLAAAKVPVYTVALGKAGSDDVDHTLLTNIASKTGGKKYDASNTTELTQVFTTIQQEIAKQSTIKTIAIRQPLPAGFTLADDAYPDAYIEEGTNTLVIPVSDIAYPYTIANKVVKVNIKKTGEGGSFKLGNAELSYKNACDSIASTPIALNANVTVYNKVTVADKYGNIYEGNRFGDVTRFRAGDGEPQWKVPGPYSGYRVTGIALTDADHTQLRVDWKNSSNSGKSGNWDLTPTTPSSSKYVIKDAKGSSITSAWDWSKGPATIQLSGSTFTKLPDYGSVNLLNDDFGSRYAYYQFRIASVPKYKDWTTIDANTKIDASGSFQVDVRAGTQAISGQLETKDVFYSGILSKTIKLDSTPPDVTVTKQFTPTYKSFKFTANVSDGQSGVDEAWLLKSGSKVQNLETNPVFYAAKDDVVSGKYTIEVTDKVGNKTTMKVDPPEDPTGPVFMMTGPTLENDVTDRFFTILVTENESYVGVAPANRPPVMPVVKVDGIAVGGYTKLDDKTYRFEFRLSDMFQNKTTRAAHHRITASAENVDGTPGSMEPFDITIDDKQPEMPVVMPYFTIDPDVFRYTVSHIVDYQTGVDTAIVYRGGVPMNGSLLQDNTFTAGKKDIENGLYTIVVTDKAGLSTSKTVTELPSDPTKPKITVQSDMVDGQDRTDRWITVTIEEEESFIRSSSVNIDNRYSLSATESTLSPDGKTAIYKFKLSEYIKDAEDRAAWHQFITSATNYAGVENVDREYVKVHPGINATLTSSNDSDSASDKPVRVALNDFQEWLVKGATFTDLNGNEARSFDPIKVTSLEYAVADSPEQPPNDSFYRLGDTEFVIVNPGEHYVFVRLEDNDNPANVKLLGPLQIRIDYDQNRS